MGADFFQKIVQIAENEIKNFTDDALVHNPEIFLEFEEGRDRILLFLKNSKPITKKECWQYYKVIRAYANLIDDFPLFINEIQFDLLLKPSEREFLRKISQLDEPALREWLLNP